MTRSNSLYYGQPTSANAFPGYSTDELRRDLESPQLDDAQRRLIEVEIDRRTHAKFRRMLQR